MLTIYWFRLLAAVLLMLVISQISGGKEAIAKVKEKPKELEATEAHGLLLDDKEADALKALGLTVLAYSDGINVYLKSETLTGDGHIKPEVMAALKKTTTMIGLNCQLASEFSDKGAGDIKDFTNLQTLHLQGTKITDAGMVNLKGMTKLDKIFLSDTAITDKGLANLKEAANLTFLDLGKVFSGKQDVSDAGLAQLNLAKMKELHIRGSKITDHGLALLKDSKDMTLLWAGNCDISDKGLEDLKPLTKLGELKLENTKVTDKGLANLKEMKQLSILDLQGCKGVGDAGIAHLEELSRLYGLNVKGTKVTQEGAANLQKKLPKCSISGSGWELKGK